MNLTLLKDWTTYVFAGIALAFPLGGLYYNEHYEIYKTDDPPAKQFNDPELKQGLWRCGTLTAGGNGGKIDVNTMVVWKAKIGRGDLCVGRVVALEGHRVSMADEDLLVDGNKFEPSGPKQRARLTRFDVPEVVVPRGCVWVVCDNRGKPGSWEVDSRNNGPVPIDAVLSVFLPRGKEAN